MTWNTFVRYCLVRLAFQTLATDGKNVFAETFWNLFFCGGIKVFLEYDLIKILDWSTSVHLRFQIMCSCVLFVISQNSQDINFYSFFDKKYHHFCKHRHERMQNVLTVALQSLCNQDSLGILKSYSLGSNMSFFFQALSTKLWRQVLLPLFLWNQLKNAWFHAYPKRLQFRERNLTQIRFIRYCWSNSPKKLNSTRRLTTLSR